MKRFQYTTRRRYCPHCGGDGKGRIFPSRPCSRCSGEGHLPEDPPEGERYILLVHDQSGKVVDIRPVKGNDPVPLHVPDGLITGGIVLILGLVVIAMILFR